MSYFSTAFLDRDGTINRRARDGEYVRTPDEVELLPNAGQAVRRLNEAGLLVVLVSNQRGVARGLLSMDDVTAVNDQLVALLGAVSAHVDAIYVCPHEKETCRCRKPLPGLIQLASRNDPAIELSKSIMIGDSESDVAAGIAAGTATIRILEGSETTSADAVAPDLASAVSLVLVEGFRTTVH
jgi:D-glycero-D-manno-heptose 1,7-bisphosphate phosphatase